MGDNVRDYGAVGDGVKDDTLALQQAFSQNLSPYVPAGRYRVTSPAGLVSYNKALVIRGDGPGATQLVWDCPDTDASLINWRSSESSHVFAVQGLTISTPALDVGGAINAEKVAPVSISRRGGVINNVEIYGDGFRRAIVLNGLVNASVQGVVINGQLGKSGTIGIEISSPSPPNKVTDSHLHDVTIVHFGIGVLMTGYQEGLSLTDSMIAGCSYGVQSSMAQNGLPGLYIRGCHLNCYSVAVALENLIQAFIVDNLIYMWGGNVGGFHVGIHLGALPWPMKKDVTIRGNQIFNNTEISGSEGGSFGVLVPGSQADLMVSIHGNHFSGFDAGIKKFAGVRGTVATDGNHYRNCRVDVSDDSQAVVADEKKTR